MVEPAQPVTNGTVSVNPSESEENILRTALEYFHTFVRPYLWLYPVSVILFLAGGFLYLRTLVPLYSSTTEVLVNSHDIHALDVRSLGDAAFAGYGRDFLNTQLKVLKSDEIMSKAYEAMGNERHLVGEPRITRLEGLNILSITTTSSNPQAAMKFANIIVDVYTRFTTQSKITISRKGTELLREQLQEIQENRNKAMKDLLKFKEEHGIFDFDQNYTSLTNQKTALTSKLFELQLDIDEIDLTFEEVAENRKQATTMLPYLMPMENNSEVPSLNHVLLQHEMKLPELMTQYSEQHQVIKVHNIVTDMIKKVMEQQVEVSLFGLKLKRQRLVKRIEHLKRQIAEIEARLVELDKIGGDYKMHETACRKLDSTITMITNRLNELEIADATKLGDLSVTVINDAKVASAPFFPQPRKIMGMSVAGGLGVALLISVLLVSMNNKTTEVTQVTQILGTDVPYFGSIPMFTDSEDKLLRTNGSETVDEVFRDIRTSLNLSMITRGSKVLAVSSSIMGEGKTFTITNLARSFARDNKRVLLMDFDMRRPRLHRILSQFLPKDTMKKGLSNVLVGDCKLEDIVVHIDELGLDVAVAGPLPPNPNELLGSVKFGELLKEVQSKFDMTFIDTPPLMLVSDTLLIAAHNVPLLLVTRMFKLPKPILIQLRERLGQLKMRVSGFIANNADVPKSHYSKSYGYGYGYGYGRYGKYGKYGKYGYGYGYGYGYHSNDVERMATTEKSGKSEKSEQSEKKS